MQVPIGILVFFLDLKIILILLQLLFSTYIMHAQVCLPTPPAFRSTSSINIVIPFASYHVAESIFCRVLQPFLHAIDVSIMWLYNSTM